MGNRGDIRNRAHFHTGGLHGADGILTSRAGAFDEQVHFLDAQHLRGLNRLFGGQAGGEGRL